MGRVANERVVEIGPRRKCTKEIGMSSAGFHLEEAKNNSPRRGSTHPALAAAPQTMASDAEPDGDGREDPLADAPKEKKRKKKRSKDSKKDKKRRKSSKSAHGDGDDGTAPTKKRKRDRSNCNVNREDETHFPFEYQHIVAPMVGASELAFRLLCRKYGATLSYTPMMSAGQFVKDAAAALNDKSNPKATIANSNICEFQTIPQDRPLAVHFSANDPADFANAAKLVEPYCDAVDLNLGCPQRTAYLGHFGSYLLGDDDRELVLSIVRAGSRAVKIPIFVKIRLLDTIEETVRLCRQLREAGASLIAIHARCECINTICNHAADLHLTLHSH